MSLRTRENPETGVTEVLVNDQWVKFEDYRRKQIDDAYQSSVRFCGNGWAKTTPNNRPRTPATKMMADPG